jgi:hypothetical protein
MQSNVTISDEERSAVPPQQVADEVQRVLHSETFRGSEVLRHLLEYLANCSFSGRNESVKGKEIAREVFGRSENFDSQGDSVVRVHTGRLRSKLAEYYMDEGADAELILSIPKGSYGLTWHPRKTALTGASAPVSLTTSENSPLAREQESIPVKEPNTHWHVRFAIAVAGAAVLALVLLVAWSKRAERPSTVDSGLKTFWQPFVSPREQPLIVFSTFRLGGSLDSEIHAVTGEPSSPNEIDTYTTTGEVMGVFEVTRMLAAFGQSARAKHGRLLTWDDAKDSNLIFVGGPLAHTPLSNLSAMKDLQFAKGSAGLPATTAAVLNLHPQDHEQKLFPGPETRPYQFDYGVIAVKPTFNQRRRALILAGITEYGTQGAADFVTQEDRVNELLAKLHVDPKAGLPCFEALIRVKIEGDVPVQYELILAHLVK